MIGEGRLNTHIYGIAQLVIRATLRKTIKGSPLFWRNT